MNRKDLKRKAKKSFLNNYWRCFAVSFIVTLLVGGTVILRLQDMNEINLSIPLTAIDGKSNSVIVNEFLNGVMEEENVTSTPGVVGAIVDNVSRSGSFVFGILNAMNQFLFHDQIVAGIIIILGVLFSILYFVFFANVFPVSKARFFLENLNYPETRVGRILLVFRVRKNFHVAMVQFYKNVLQFFWMFTIVGGPIKFYSYRMVPYLLAENPEISANDALKLSESMMRGHRMELFLFDCSFLGWGLLGLFTFNVFNLFYTNPYKEASEAAFYLSLRSSFVREENQAFFCDAYLGENSSMLEEYPEEKYFLKEHSSRKFLRYLRYDRDYSLTSYILLFFAFSCLGWLWEEGITLFSSGIFVNRGALFGPWLPIYGSGGVLILFLLRNYRDRPFLLFFLTVILCGVIEYGTALYLETFKHLKWWDYTGFFLNLHGRICLEGLLFFGIGGLFFVYVLGPILDNFFQKWNPTFKAFLCVVLVLCIACDFIYSGKYPNTGNGVTTELVS